MCTFNPTHLWIALHKTYTIFICKFLQVCICVWTEFNQETNGSVEHLIHQPIAVSMWWSDSFYFSVWTRLPVNRIQSRNNWNSWASNPSSDSCQYVVVSFLLLQCVDTLRVNRIKSGSKCNCWALNHQAIPVNMLWSVSFSFSVWILSPVNRI